MVGVTEKVVLSGCILVPPQQNSSSAYVQSSCRDLTNAAPALLVYYAVGGS